MGFSLDEVVPWGRSFEEYVAMFGLSTQDLKKTLLGCGDGPASFNRFLTKAGGRIISIDPIYQFSTDEINNRIKDTYSVVMAQTRQNQQEFVWSHISSLEELGKIRMAAMQAFLSHYPTRREEGRYLPMSLPELTFENQQFEIALCSHLLFLYSQQLSATFHVNSIKAMCRVATEVRIFPLLELGALKSHHLDTVSSSLRAEGYQVSIVKVDYEFQKGGHEMMKVVNGE